MAQYVRDHHRASNYVTTCRVAEAQRLLLTTSMETTEIAGAAGFGSLSSFYEHVTAACGATPWEYRAPGIGGEGLRRGRIEAHDDVRTVDLPGWGNLPMACGSAANLL